MIGKQRRFPYGAFVTLTVTQNHEDPVGFFVLFRRQSHARTGRESVAQRSGGEIHAGQMVGNVTGQAAAVGIVGLQFLHREEAGFCQRGVNGGAGVTLAENKAIPLIPVRLPGVAAHHIRVQNRHNVRYRHNGADMAAPGQMGHLNPMPPDQPG